MERLLPGGEAWGTGLPDLVFRGWRVRELGILRNPSSGATVWDILTDSDQPLHRGGYETQREETVTLGDLTPGTVREPCLDPDSRPPMKRQLWYQGKLNMDWISGGY